MLFNTAIAKMMEFINDFSKLPSYPRSVLRMLAQALMPFAPHLAEEVWEMLGSKEVLAYHPWPSVEEHYLHEETAVYVVQVPQVKLHWLPIWTAGDAWSSAARTITTTVV